MSHADIQFEGGTIQFSINGTPAQINAFVARLPTVQGIVAPSRNTHILDEGCAWFSLRLKRGANPEQVVRQLKKLTKRRFRR